MSPEENKAVVRRLLDEVWNGGNLDAVEELHAADFVEHNGMPGRPAGAEGVRWSVEMY